MTRGSGRLAAGYAMGQKRLGFGGLLRRKRELRLFPSFFGATLLSVHGQQDESSRPGDGARDRRPRECAALGRQIREDRDPNGKQGQRGQSDGVNGCWPDALERHVLIA